MGLTLAWALCCMSSLPLLPKTITKWNRNNNKRILKYFYTQLKTKYEFKWASKKNKNLHSHYFKWAVTIHVRESSCTCRTCFFWTGNKPLCARYDNLTFTMKTFDFIWSIQYWIIQLTNAINQIFVVTGVLQYK